MWKLGVSFLLGAAVFGAQAEIIREADLPDGARVYFHDTIGPCKRDARFVEWVGKDGESIPGCYRAVEDKLVCVFLDVDVGVFPFAATRPPTRS